MLAADSPRQNAEDLLRTFLSDRDRIQKESRGGSKHRTIFLSEGISTWARERFGDDVFTISRSVGKHAMKREYLLDLMVFQKGKVRPLVGAEFEWSNARDGKREKQDTLFELLLPGEKRPFRDAAQKDRAFDLLKVLVATPEIGVFGGWENSRRGDAMTCESLLDGDRWLLESFAKSLTIEPLYLLYLAFVRPGRGKRHEFKPVLFGMRKQGLEELR